MDQQTIVYLNENTSVVKFCYAALHYISDAEFSLQSNTQLFEIKI